MTILRERLPAIAVLGYLLSLGLPMGQTPALILLAGAGLFAAATPGSTSGAGLSPVDKALLALLMTGIISTLAAVDRAHALEMTLIWTPGLLLYYLVRVHLGLRWIPVLSLGLTLLALLVSIRALAVAWDAADPDPTELMAAVGLVYLRVPNDLLLIALCAPFSLLLLQRYRSWPVGMGVATCLALTLTAIILYRSNVALLAFVIVAIGGLRMLWPQYTLPALTLLAGGALLIDGLTGFALMGKFTDLQVWGNRVPLWQAAWQMFLDHPFWGVGPGGFSILVDPYSVSLEHPPWVTPDPRHTPWAHNLYLEVLAERGLAGLATLILVGFSLFRVVWRCPAAGSAGHYASLLAWSLGALTIAGLIEISLLRSWVLALLALMAAMATLLWRESRT